MFSTATFTPPYTNIHNNTQFQKEKQIAISAASMVLYSEISVHTLAHLLMVIDLVIDVLKSVSTIISNLNIVKEKSIGNGETFRFTTVWIMEP